MSIMHNAYVFFKNSRLASIYTTIQKFGVGKFEV